ncbi:MAG: response regulator [Endomicrobium sp.]|jgi:CheY-like chemotaxis protein/HPt (histidine-containing phosphotransfer) domain-containing protein|nr:response regulator [Endomicrobium sp.]
MVETIKPNFEGRSILIAEDTEINKEIIRVFLQTTKAKLYFTSDGTEVLAAFEADSERYDLILMDVLMPKMDGLEATRKIRSLNVPKAKTVPIVALTVNTSPEDIRKSFDSGMNDHIGKPIEINTMFETLKKYIPEAKMGAGAETKENKYLKYMPYIDVKDGVSRLMNDEKLYFHLLKSFDGKKFAEDLINSINAADQKASSIMAHTIKGISANLGLKALCELSKEVEGQAKLNAGLSDFTARIKEVSDKTMQMIAELTA